jgi:hypothetical protein
MAQGPCNEKDDVDGMRISIGLIKTITYWRIYYIRRTFSIVAAPQISAPLQTHPFKLI